MVMHKELTNAEDTHSHGHRAAWPSTGCAVISHYGGPRILEDRASDALAPGTPSATLPGAALCELKTAYEMTYGRGAASQPAPSDARIPLCLSVPWAVLHGD